MCTTMLVAYLFFFTLTSNDAMFFECAQIPLLQPAGVAQCARVGQNLMQLKDIKSSFQLLDFQFPKNEVLNILRYLL